MSNCNKCNNDCNCRFWQGVALHVAFGVGGFLVGYFIIGPVWRMLF